VRRHVQAVRNQRQRTEQAAADDLNRHHHAAQNNDTPGLALVLLVAGAEERVTVRNRIRGIVDALPDGGCYLK
jgi:hypothetical protein